MIRHMVVAKPNDAEAVASIFSEVAALTPTFGGLANVENGVDISGRSAGFTHILIMDFNGPDDLTAWAQSETHAALRERLLAVAEMFVIDYRREASE